MFGNWFITLVFCGLTFIPTYILFVHKHSTEGGLIFGCFALLALAQLLYMIRDTLDLYKYGEVRFVSTNIAPALGGELAGEVLLSRATSGSKILHAELHCLQITFSTNNKGRTTRNTKRVWYGEGKFRVHRQARGSMAEIRIPIPYRAGTESGIEYEWELQVHLDVAGIDLNRTFPIDVLKGSPPVATVPDRPTTQEQAESIITANDPYNPKTAQLNDHVGTNPAITVSEMPLPEQTLATPSVIGLVAANMVPIAGVIFFDWKVQDIVMLYWFENLIIGVMNVLRIYTASPDQILKPKEKGTGLRPYELFTVKMYLIGFFIVHYGGFCYGHGLVLAGTFTALEPHGRHMELGEILVKMFTDPVYLLSIAALFSEHLFSFFHNYIGKGEYHRADIGLLMVRPYGRIYVTHLFIFLGGIVILLLANSIIAIITFVVIKILIDQYMHRRERVIMSTPNN